NGYFIAFSRFAQYHTVLFIAFQAVVLCTFKTLKEDEKRARTFWACLAAVCAGFGLLTHYDFILFAFLSLLMIVLLMQKSSNEGIPLYLLLPVIFLGVLMPMTFYLPFALNPNFPEKYYLYDRIGGSTSGYRRFDFIWALSSIAFYSSIYYTVAFLALAGIGLYQTRKDWRHLGSETVSGATAYIQVWFFSYFIAYVILMGRPQTHIYTIFIPGVFLAAKGSLQVFHFRWKSKIWKAGWFSILSLIFTLTLFHTQIFFWNHNPEYVYFYPESKDPLFPVIEGQGTQVGHFGVPKKRAWKVLGVLFRDGILSGSYQSNENPELTEWYIGAPQSEGSIYYFFYVLRIREHFQTYSLEDLETGWTRIGQVFKGEQKTIIMFCNGTCEFNLGDLNLDDYKERFDELMEAEFSS
ncbi:MAG: hypothetical protein ACXAB4_07700, partial [Candidatus Hodarchaeales archaeon]